MPTTLISSLTEEPTSAICVSTAERSAKTFKSKTKDIETREGIYCDMMEEKFTMVTGLYPRFDGWKNIAERNFY